MQVPGQIHCFENAGFDVVAIAASLGGLQVLRDVLSALPADFSAPILVVQHLSGTFPTSFTDFLGRRLRFKVEWARHGATLCARTIYLAPPDRHLTVTARCTAELSDGPRAHFARPAADRLFASAAASFGPRALGIVLSGRLEDGALGAAAIHRAGGVVLAQDPRTCRAPDMPEAAIRSGAVDFVLPPETLASALVSLVMVPGARALFGVRESPLPIPPPALTS